MTKKLKIVTTLVFATMISACAGQQEEEIVIVEPAPIIFEPTSNKF